MNNQTDMKETLFKILNTFSNHVFLLFIFYCKVIYLYFITRKNCFCLKHVYFSSRSLSTFEILTLYVLIDVHVNHISVTVSNITRLHYHVSYFVRALVITFFQWSIDSQISSFLIMKLVHLILLVQVIFC